MATPAQSPGPAPYEPPSFIVAMAQKDLRLMIEEAKRRVAPALMQGDRAGRGRSRHDGGVPISG